MGSTPHFTGAPNLPLGTVIEDRYEIVDVLGSGGFATVYKAHQINVERSVAIKVLDQLRRGDEEKVERFQREAQIAAQIDHPNIVTIFDTGIIASTQQPYIVMELLAGDTLRDELRTYGAIAPDRCLPLFLNCLDGLQHAHDRNIVHKDLKPSNLFLNHPRQRRETLRIVDFGVARILTNDTAHVTLTGNIFGTPRYFAPEYIQRQLVTPSLDVYQMGLILVEALTGHAVVDVDNPLECIRIHGSGEIGVPTSLLKGPLGKVLIRALAVDFRARFADAGAFCEALGQVDPASVRPCADGEAVSLIGDVSGSLRAVAFAPKLPVGDMTPEPSRVPAIYGDTPPAAHFDEVEGDGDTKVSVVAFSGGEEGLDIFHADDSGSMLVVADPEDVDDERVQAAYTGPSLTPFVIAVVVLTLVLILGVVGIVVKVLTGEEPEVGDAELGTLVEAPVGPETVEEPLDDEAPVEVTDPDERDVEASADGGGDEVGSDMVEGVSEILVELVTDPPGATLFRGEETVGASPHLFRFTAAEEAGFEIHTELAGYNRSTVTVAPASAPQLVVPLLRRLRAVPKTVKKPKDKPAMKIVP